MGTISSSIGLVSGLDTANIIEQLLALEAAPRTRLAGRIGELRTQQTALLDVNARLLNFKNSARSFRNDSIFDATVGASSNEEVLGVTTSETASPGTYSFIVRQLVSNSQQMSRGFATRDETPLGLSELSFEFGAGRLSSDILLEELNGGTGVDRGQIVITDRNGDEATVDLSDVVTVSEVVDRINETGGIAVAASIEGDRIVIRDESGGAGTLTVADGDGDTTATDLGIAGSAAGDTLTGDDSVYRIGNATALSSLNDGTGVLIRDNVVDFTITDRAGRTYDIDLGRIDQDITTDTLLADLDDGNGIPIDTDTDSADIRFVARDGTEFDVDLSGVTTVGGLATRISTATSGQITLSIAANGEQFTITDTVGGSGDLQILGGDAGTDVASALGILNEDGVAADSYTGDIVPSTIDLARAATIEDVLDRINNAVDDLGADNAGRIVASIAADGRGIDITDTTGAVASNLIITSTASNPFAAQDLGLDNGPGGDAAATVAGDRLIGGLDTILLSSLNGGAGIDLLASFNLTDRNGASGSIDLSGLAGIGETVGDLITYLNDEVSALGASGAFSLNGARNGLQFTDTSGGTGSLIIEGDGADAIGVSTGVAGVVANTVSGTNLQAQYVSESTELAQLNGGRGVGTGSFEITDGLGETATVSIGGDERSVFDVIQEINSRGLAVSARINDNGDGIIIEEDLTDFPGSTPFRAISVETVSGTAASDLNLVGEAAAIGGSIDGSFERTVDVDTSDTLNEVVAKINAAGIPVTASVVNTGSGATPFRLSLASGISGAAGDLVIDTNGVDLGLTATSRGQDARVFFGSDDPADGLLLTSDTNTLDSVLDGVSIDLLAVSDDPITVSVSRDTATIEETVAGFVTTFNDVIGRLDQYDFFDVETEERGVLLGDPTVARVRNGLYRILNGGAQDVDGPYRFLFQVGVTVGSGGLLNFDRDEFREAYADDPEGVEALFASFEQTRTTTEEISEGITINTNEVSFTSLGYGDLFDQFLDDLTNSVDGVLSRQDDVFNAQIEDLEDRIEDLDDRLESRRLALQREFANLELALSELQEQGSALSGIQPVA